MNDEALDTTTKSKINLIAASAEVHQNPNEFEDSVAIDVVNDDSPQIIKHPLSLSADEDDDDGSGAGGNDCSPTSGIVEDEDEESQEPPEHQHLLLSSQSSSDNSLKLFSSSPSASQLLKNRKLLRQRQQQQNSLADAENQDQVDNNEHNRLTRLLQQSARALLDRASSTFDIGNNSEQHSETQPLLMSTLDGGNDKPTVLPPTKQHSFTHNSQQQQQQCCCECRLVSGSSFSSLEIQRNCCSICSGSIVEQFSPASGSRAQAQQSSLATTMDAGSSSIPSTNTTTTATMNNYNHSHHYAVPNRNNTNNSTKSFYGQYSSDDDANVVFPHNAPPLPRKQIFIKSSSAINNPQLLQNAQLSEDIGPQHRLHHKHHHHHQQPQLHHPGLYVDHTNHYHHHHSSTSPHHHHHHHSPIDQYPTSPFGNCGAQQHSTTFCDSQKTCMTMMTDHGGTGVDDQSINVKFPKLKYLKVCLLSLLVIYTLISFIFIQEKKETWTNVAVQDKLPAYLDLSQSLDLMFPVWKLRARGSFLPKEYGHLTNYSIIFTIVQMFNDTATGVQGASSELIIPHQSSYRVVKRPWAAPIAPTSVDQYIPAKEIEHTFKLARGDVFDQNYRYRLRIDTNSKESIGITVSMSGFSELSADGIILAASVLIFLYVLIIFEIVNRTLAAMLGATAAITCLTLIRDRPSLAKVVSWLDVETLSLLFGMMILVAILCETGFFDYVAVVAFRLAKGSTWPLIFTLCIFTGVMSAFLDNVTTILLMTPVTIRLCEIKNIEPKHVLISLVIISNIGGAATPVGDPPNVIIISSASIQQQGINFGRFTMHMMPGIILSFLATLVYIRIYYRNLSMLEFQDASSSNDDDTEENLNEFKRKHEKPPPQQFILQPTGNNKQQQPIITDDHQFSRQNGRVVVDHSHHYHHHTFQPYELPSPIGPAVGYTETMFGGTTTTSQPLSPQMLKQCPSFTNLEDLCAGNSFKDHLWDERRVFRSSDELKREIEVWKRACNSIVGYSRDENSVRTMLNKKVETLETILKQHCYETVPPEDNYRSVLAELEQKYKIRDWPLLIKSVVVMSMVISLFFMQSIPNLDLSLGWIAILGAILLLVVSDRHELESILGRVEWSTLIFFAALFVVMEALAELKFLWWIGQLTQDFINSVPEHSRLIVAILVFIWISALSSSFIDNIPLTTVMVKIIEDLSENNEFNIPLVPLIYALAFGACLGGNGTLIGASSNVVCSGVAEQHGYRFTFLDFFKIGFPIMLLTVSISTVYLIICHVVFEWNI